MLGLLLNRGIVPKTRPPSAPLVPPPRGYGGLLPVPPKPGPQAPNGMQGFLPQPSPLARGSSFPPAATQAQQVRMRALSQCDSTFVRSLAGSCRVLPLAPCILCFACLHVDEVHCSYIRNAIRLLLCWTQLRTGEYPRPQHLSVHQAAVCCWQVIAAQYGRPVAAAPDQAAALPGQPVVISDPNTNRSLPGRRPQSHRMGEHRQGIPVGQITYNKYAGQQFYTPAQQPPVASAPAAAAAPVVCARGATSTRACKCYPAMELFSAQ